MLCTEDDYVQQVRDITGGEGAYGAFDCVAGEGTADVVKAVRDGGTILIYGALAGFQFTAGVPDILFQAKVVSGLPTWRLSAQNCPGPETAWASQPDLR